MGENHQQEKKQRKISIILPNAGKTEGRFLSSPRRSRIYSDADVTQTRNREMSVTSYVVQHCKRKNRGNFVPQLWNDLAPFLSYDNIQSVRTTPSGWWIGGSSQKMAQKIIDPWDEINFDNEAISQVEVNDDKNEEKIETSSQESTMTPISSRSETSAADRRVSSLVPIPIVNYKRPQIATKKGNIYYSDVPVLRKQMQVLFENRAKVKYRQDFARTSHDIYRLKLNRPESAGGRFRETCATYLATTPGSARAISGQLQ